MKHRLRDLLPFKKAPKGIGLTISRQTYLSLLATTSRLPTLRDIIEPKGENGAVVGFGVPLDKTADKSQLDEPMRRGAYALATKDQKTVLRMIVVNPSEAGFDGEGLLKSSIGESLPAEVRTRIGAAWNIVQITFESYDPAFYPALDFYLACAHRIAELTDAVVADPIARTYRLPNELAAPNDQGLPFATSAHVMVHRESGHLYTLGLSKFNLPEFEVYDVEDRAIEPAKKLLVGLAQASLRVQSPKTGDRIGLAACPIRVAEGGLDRGRWEGIPCLELIPEGAHSISECLIRWHNAPS